MAVGSRAPYPEYERLFELSGDKIQSMSSDTVAGIFEKHQTLASQPTDKTGE